MSVVFLFVRVRASWSDPGRRGLASLLGDMSTFWPRGYHPWAAPSYAERSGPGTAAALVGAYGPQAPGGDQCPRVRLDPGRRCSSAVGAPASHAANLETAPPAAGHRGGSFQVRCVGGRCSDCRGAATARIEPYPWALITTRCLWSVSSHKRRCSSGTASLGIRGSRPRVIAAWPERAHVPQQAGQPPAPWIGPAGSHPYKEEHNGHETGSAAVDSAGASNPARFASVNGNKSSQIMRIWLRAGTPPYE